MLIKILSLQNAGKIIMVLLILTLGCAGTDAVLRGAQSDGLKITRFEPDLKEVQEGGKVVLALLVQNTGLFSATAVSANLFMHDGFEGAAWTKSIDPLKPANTELNTPGGTAEVLWDMTAPKIAKGENTYPFNFLLDLAYGYESSGFREVPIIKYERVLQLKQANKPLPKGQESYLNGPLGISINADDPIILKETEKAFTLKVMLSLKSGYIKEDGSVSGDCGSEKLNCVRSVEIELPDGLSIDTGNDEDGDANCAFDASGKKSYVKLVEGKEAVLSCKIKISRDAEEFNPTIKVRTEYRHHVRGEAPIAVKK